MKTLDEIITLIEKKSHQIDDWFKTKWQSHTPLPYFSCDIRHASYKIGLVDTNLFPAGFNNLCPAFTRETAAAFKNYFSEYYPQVKKVLLLGEKHTRNKFYLLNLLHLKNLIQESGVECKVTLPLDTFPEPQVQIPIEENKTLLIEEVKVIDGKISIDDFIPDIILSNNDFSTGIPEPFENVNIPIVPSSDLGWHKRSKSKHFQNLQQLIQEFSQEFSIDPWLLFPITESVSEVYENNLAKLADKVDDVLKEIQRKYAEYNVSETPYVFIKNDSGTYGLGILAVQSSEEVLSLNRKKRSKLFATKGGSQSNRFLVQEGIPTYDTYSGYPIEPVIYGVGKTPVGGFFRIHEGKNPFESLNAPGMSFSCLCLHKLDEPHETYFINCKHKQNLVQVSKFLARFASLAAALEHL